MSATTSNELTISATNSSNDDIVPDPPRSLLKGIDTYVNV